MEKVIKLKQYSFNNTLLIAMQRPDATLLAGYQTWQKKFHRHVKRGEKGIKIIAPVPVKEKRQVEKIDEETQEIVIGIDGQPETETVERILPRFRVTTVFDVSQTEGEPLPTLEVNELVGDVFIYEDFMKGLEEISPVPFQFQEIDSGAKGYYSNAEKLVAIQTGMSQAQTMKTAVHETAHAILHDRDVMSTSDVVILKRDGEMKAYYVNDIGFRELPEFIKQRSELLRETNSGLVVKQDKSGKEQEEPEKIREDRTITETIQSNEHLNVSKKKNQQMQAGLHR